MRLRDKVCVVVGGGAGIGRASALGFAREGASVVVADIDATAGEATARAAHEAGGDAVFVGVDITSVEQVKALVAATVARYGRITTLMNCALTREVLNDGTVVDVDLGVWQRILDVMLNGPFLCCRYAIPELIRAGGGSVINVSSVDAVVGQPGYDAYVAAKGAILSLTRSMATEFAANGVRVNAIMPGIVRSATTAGWLERESALSAAIDMHLVPRIGEPEDIAGFAVYLASDEASWVTGHGHYIDGGYAAFKTRVADYTDL